MSDASVREVCFDEAGNTGQHLLFPSGDLSDPSPVNVNGKHCGKVRKHVSTKLLNTWLHEAEALAGIETKPSRAFHGLKRTVVTTGMDVMTREQMAELTGTHPATLAAIYRKHTMRSKMEGLAKLEQARGVLRGRTDT